jgi:hypothetical protein
MGWFYQHAAAWLVAVALIAVITAMVFFPHHVMAPLASPAKVEIVPSDRPDRVTFEEGWIDDSSRY